MKLVVETADLRQALASVVPHVHADRTYGQLHRVRVSVEPENVLVYATCGPTAALAVVSLWEHEDGELGPVDLSPADVRSILNLFPGKHANDDEPEQTVRLETTDEHLVVTDISGLFPGKQLRLPLLEPDTNFPDLPAEIRARLAVSSHPTERLVLSGQLLKLFVAATKVYGRPLVAEPAGAAAAVLISCGESFLGILKPHRLKDEERAEIDAWRSNWTDRLDARGTEL